MSWRPTTNLSYVQQVTKSNSCSKCGGHLVIVAIDGQVRLQCLRCDHRKVTFNTRFKGERDVENSGKGR